ncbi:MAG TPA: peptidylprolyl isomerase [Candidatus Binatia bacterium]|nr:peptidylprolyl isomerase [Candidatus Binatia bacterium]
MRGNPKYNLATVLRVLGATLLLVAGLLLATALPARGQTRAVQTATTVPAGTGGSVPHPLPKPVARVNGSVLTDVDLLREMYAIFPYAKQHNGTFPRSLEPDIRRGALKMIEFEELVYQEAKRRQMSIAPERLAKAEKQFRDRFATEQAYREFLQVETSGSVPAFRTKIARSLLIEDLLKLEITDKSGVSLAEARAYYTKYPEHFKLPETFAVQTITVMPPVRPSREQPNPPPANAQQWVQMRIRAEDALRQAKTTKTYEEFGILAEKISEDDYRVMMGDHKSVEVKDLPPAIALAASKMQPGQISDIIQAEGALTIVRLNAHTPARKQSFHEAYDGLRAQLENRKQEALRRGLDAKLRKNAKIEEL